MIKLPLNAMYRIGEEGQASIVSLDVRNIMLLSLLCLGILNMIPKGITPNILSIDS